MLNNKSDFIMLLCDFYVSTVLIGGGPAMKVMRIENVKEATVVNGKTKWFEFKTFSNVPSSASFI